MTLRSHPRFAIAREVDLGAPLGLSDAAAVAGGEVVPVLGQHARRRIEQGHGRLRAAVADGHRIYGITTGFGPLADRIVAASDAETLQRNLVYHLATGVGSALPWPAARALALARLRCISVGVSGASQGLADRLLALLASPFAPEIPEKGTVGASGDLTPLAHLALALMGEGRMIDRAGRAVPAREALATIGCQPLTLAARDGLALVNGTSAMTGISVLNAVAAGLLFGWAERLTACLGHALRCRAEAWSPALSALRPHPGQAVAAAALTRHAAGSCRIETRAVAGLAPGAGGRALQDAYTLRCAPQVIGACRDALAWHDAVVERELNAVTDNPVFPETGGDTVVHGGNFMGQHVAFAADALSAAVVSCAGLAERQVARLTDEALNGGLPAFLHRGAPGLNSGLMGAQVTATALHAEMRTRAGRASVQSISTNAANQDVVSMGTIAARVAAQTLEDAWRVMAILAIAVARAGDILVEDGEPEMPALSRLRAAIAPLSPPFEGDRPLSAEIEAVAGWLASTPESEV